MKSYFLLFALSSFFTIAFNTVWSQAIESSEENYSFTTGSQPAIIVTIPFADEKIAEKFLKAEMKDWGRDFDIDKGEFRSKQGTIKAMGGKAFDAYCHIFPGRDQSIKIAIAIDLGGAYMNKRDHKSQYEVMQDKMEKLAFKIAIESIEEELNREAKVLRKLEKEKEEHISNVASSKKNIEEYQERIKQAEQRIKENEEGTEKKKGEIEEQNKKIEGIADRKKRLK